MIPKILHQIWLGPKPLSQKHTLFMNSWQELHADWEYRLWTDADVPSLQNQTCFDAATHYGMKSNILRYEILKNHGGFYLDLDMSPLRSLDDLINHDTVLGAVKAPRSLCNAFMGCSEGNAFITGLVETLPDNFNRFSELPSPIRCGSRFLGDYALANPEGVTILPDSAFFPLGVGDPRLFEPITLEAYPESYGVHLWEHSWVTKGSNG